MMRPPRMSARALNAHEVCGLMAPVRGLRPVVASV